MGWQKITELVRIAAVCCVRWLCARCTIRRLEVWRVQRRRLRPLSTRNHIVCLGCIWIRETRRLSRIAVGRGLCISGTGTVNAVEEGSACSERDGIFLWSWSSGGLLASLTCSCSFSARPGSIVVECALLWLSSFGTVGAGQVQGHPVVGIASDLASGALATGSSASRALLRKSYWSASGRRSLGLRRRLVLFGLHDGQHTAQESWKKFGF